MGTLSWIIWAGTKCHHKCLYKGEAERFEEAVLLVLKMKERALSQEGKECFSRGRKGKETDSPLELPEEAQPS